MKKIKNLFSIGFYKKIYLAITLLFSVLLLSLVRLEYVAERGIVFKFGVVPFIVLAVIASLLAVAEKKIGYYSYIKDLVVNEYKYTVSLSSPRLIVHALAQLLTFASFALVFIYVLVSHVSGEAYIAVFIFTVLAVAMQIADRAVNKRDTDAARLFLIIALLVGIMMCYTLPFYTGVSWDEQIHINNIFSTVYSSDGQFSMADYNQAWHEYYRDSGKDFSGFIADPGALAETMITDDAAQGKFVPTPYSIGTVFAYLPMLLGAFAAEILNMDAVKMFMLCRMANLLAFAFICYLGIRKLKSGQYVFSAVCLLPGMLFLACSYGYDYWISAWIMYVMAYIISEFQNKDKKFTAWDFAKIAIAFIIGCSPKAIYCFMLVPLLFLKKSKFENRKMSVIMRVLTVAVIIIVASNIIIGGTYSGFYTDNRGGSDVNSFGQMKYVLTNPFEYALILIKHLVGYFSFVNAANSLCLFGNLSEPHIAFGAFAIVILLYCILTDRRRDDNYELMQGARLGTLLVGLVQAVLVSTALYVSFTPVGASAINGVQYRYVFPYLAGTCFFLRPLRLGWYADPKWQTPVVFGMLSLNVLASYFSSYIVRFIL